MSKEITVAASLSVDNGTIFEFLSKAGVRFDWTTHQFTKVVQSIGTSEEAILLGEVSGSLGWCVAVNLDPTNFVSLRTGTGTPNAIKLPANGGVALFHWGSGATAPYAIADTAACKVAFLIIAQ